VEERLPGGRNDGAVRRGDTVRRTTGSHTRGVHALLDHLHNVGFHRVPRVLGIDEAGREILSYLQGLIIGEARPWPAWARSDGALVAAGSWLRDFHAASASFVPPEGAQWFGDHHALRAGEIIGHHDAAPYNAVWDPADDPGAETSDGHSDTRAAGRLVGFIDWDLAGPASPLRDLAFMALTWVPLTARDVAGADGFPAAGNDDVVAERGRRLRLLLHAYGWDGDIAAVLGAVRQRADEHAAGLRQAASDGYGPAVDLVAEGVADAFERAVSELDADASALAAFEGPRRS